MYSPRRSRRSDNEKLRDHPNNRSGRQNGGSPKRMYGGETTRYYDPYYGNYGSGTIYYVNSQSIGRPRAKSPGSYAPPPPLLTVHPREYQRNDQWRRPARVVKPPPSTNNVHEAHTRTSITSGLYAALPLPPRKIRSADEQEKGNMLEMLRSGLASRLRTERSLVREFLAEFIATAFFLLIGISANIQSAASPGGNVVSAQLAWGFGLAFGVYLAVNVSGGHLNPAISLATLITGDLSLIRFMLYVIAQLLGAFIGTAIAFFGHYDDIRKMDTGTRQVFGPRGTAGLLTTFPADHMTRIGALADQIIGTAILAGVLCLLGDRKHRISMTMIPLLAGVTLTMIAMTFGANAGFAVNPARDFAPRLFALCVGYGTGVFSAANYYFWVPIVGPFIGALIGALLYKLFVGVHGLSEQVEITGGAPYPRDDRGYKVGARS